LRLAATAFAGQRAPSTDRKHALTSHPGALKNTLQFKTLFALSSLWMVRHPLLAAQG
jgi:hypothetical protein